MGLHFHAQSGVGWFGQKGSGHVQIGVDGVHPVPCQVVQAGAQALVLHNVAAGKGCRRLGREQKPFLQGHPRLVRGADISSAQAHADGAQVGTTGAQVKGFVLQKIPGQAGQNVNFIFFSQLHCPGERHGHIVEAQAAVLFQLCKYVADDAGKGACLGVLILQRRGVRAVGHGNGPPVLDEIFFLGGEVVMARQGDSFFL